MIRALALLTLVACGARETTETPTPEPTPAPEPAPEPTASDTISVPTDAGEVMITPVQHATTVLAIGEQTFWLDPWSQATLDAHPKGDVILITDIHPDHLDPAAITTVSKPDAVIVAPRAVADQLEGVDHVLANGEEVVLGEVTVTAVPMYNEERGPEGGGVYHEKGRGNGYILAVGGKRIYFAGDTECTDEMKALKDIDVAFLPMNLPYTMTPAEAAECAKAFQPARLVPYHYRGSELTELTSALEGTEVEVEQVEYYPGQ